MKHIFIVNPVAGVGTAEKTLIPTIKSFVKEHEFDYEIHRSLNKSEIGSYCKQRASVGDDVRFYACGGDGTINDVANGIIGFPNAQLAIIPCGSGNDFVRCFTNKNNFLDIEKQANGAAVDIDLIKMTNSEGVATYTVNMLNIGTDCDIAYNSKEMQRLPWVSGSASYVASALKILPQGRKYYLHYKYEGEEKDVVCLLCSMANGQFCGGGFRNAPKASLTDGLMDVSFIAPVPTKLLMPLMLKYRKGTHLEDERALPYIHSFQTSKLTLKPLADVNVCVDGECSPLKEVTLEIVPKSIKLVVPQGCEML